MYRLRVELEAPLTQLGTSREEIAATVALQMALMTAQITGGDFKVNSLFDRYGKQIGMWSITADEGGLSE